MLFLEDEPNRVEMEAFAEMPPGAPDGGEDPFGFPIAGVGRDL